MQGRRDTALSEEGRAAVARWRLPEPWASAPVVSSPLRRCLDTVEILRANHPRLGGQAIEPRLIERDWGTWEGRTLAEMRQELGGAMARAEALGLDFRPENGESARDMQQRLTPALQEMAEQGEDRLVVAHRGVIRAVYSLATGWDMRDKPADKMARDALQVFAIADTGRPEVIELNLQLSGETVD